MRTKTRGKNASWKCLKVARVFIFCGLLLRDLAVYAVVEQSTLSRAIDQLALEGRVNRSPDPDDSRAMRISITTDGRADFERLWPTMAQAYRRMFDGISAREQAAFVSTLQTILANIRQHDI